MYKGRRNWFVMDIESQYRKHNNIAIATGIINVCWRRFGN